MASLPSSPSTTLYYKACTKHFPVLLCTTKLAQSTSQYYVVLQSLHKALPSITLYYKACTKHFPVLLWTTKLTQANSQYYCGLQSLQQVFPSTTLYNKACKRYFSVLLCTTKLAQSTSQYYFVVQSLHKARSITTLLWQPMPMLMAPWSFRRRSGKMFSDLSMAVCWDFWSEINSIWSIFVVLRLCCPVVVTATRKGNIRIYIYIYILYIYIITWFWPIAICPYQMGHPHHRTSPPSWKRKSKVSHENERIQPDADAMIEATKPPWFFGK